MHEHKSSVINFRRDKASQSNQIIQNLNRLNKRFYKLNVLLAKENRCDDKIPNKHE